MIRNILILIAFLIKLHGVAQIPVSQLERNNLVFPKERIKVTINANLLLAGEMLHYKGYVLTSENKPSNLSKILYVSLRNNQDSIVFTHKLKVEKGNANGDFFIPASLETGVYKLIAYTNLSRNNIDNPFDEKQLYIINTFIENKNTAKDGTLISIDFSEKDEANNPKTTRNSQNIKVGLDKEVYGKRDKVRLTLTALDSLAAGNYSISVRKVAPIKIKNEQSKIATSNTNSRFYLPELRGELISGVVTSIQDNKPVANQVVALSVPGENFLFKTSKTNGNGQFFIAIDSPIEVNKALIQVFANDQAKNTFKIALDTKKLKLKPNNSYKLTIDSQLKDWLQQRSTYLQIENAYFEVKRDSVLTSPTEPIFFGSLGVEYKLDDFTRFSTIKETFTEVISLAAIRGKGAAAKFIVYNPYDPNGIANFNDVDPLVIINGVLIQNNTDLLNYNAHDIESIRVVNNPYRYGSKIYSGIIAVKTNDKNFVSKLNNHSLTEISIDKWVERKKYYNPDYTDKNFDRIPDYRVQLLWQPNVVLKTQHSETFFTSDIEGNYEIVIHGFTDTGKLINDTFKISVK